jgi:hypothetical protein
MLRHGTTGFTSSPMEAVTRISIKIRAFCYVVPCSREHGATSHKAVILIPADVRT